MCYCVCSSIIIFLGPLFVIFFNVGMRQGNPLVGLLFVLAHFHILCYSLGFSFCVSSLPQPQPCCFPCFCASQLAYVGLFIQHHKFQPGFHLSSLLGLSPLLSFVAPYDIKILNVPFSFVFFVFSFLEEALNEDV